MFLFRLACLTCLLSLLMQSGYGQELSEVESLIDQLASKNKPPKVRIEVTPYALFPRDFDWSDQKRVIGIIEILHNKAQEDMPALLSHLDDKRYCITLESDQSASNYSVGRICSLLLQQSLVAGYQDCLKGDQRVFNALSYPESLESEDACLEYLKDKKNTRLIEIQIDLTKQAIRGAKALKFLDDDEKQVVVKRLEERLNHLSTNKKAFPPGRIFNKEYRAPISKDRAAYMK